MDPVTGALVAASIGWLSIVVAIRMPSGKRRIDSTGIRRAGAAAIATMALSAFGVDIPMWAPLAVFATGLLLIGARPARDASPAAPP